MTKADFHLIAATLNEAICCSRTDRLRPARSNYRKRFCRSDAAATTARKQAHAGPDFWSEQHRETPLYIFVTEPFDFAEEYKRSIRREVAPGLTVQIVSLDALFAMKREAGRPKDLADIDELSLLHGLPSSYDRAE